MRYTLLYLAANALTVQLWVCFPKFIYFPLKRWLGDGYIREPKVSQDVIRTSVPAVKVNIMRCNAIFSSVTLLASLMDKPFRYTSG